MVDAHDRLITGAGALPHRWFRRFEIELQLQVSSAHVPAFRHLRFGNDIVTVVFSPPTTNSREAKQLRANAYRHF